MMPVREFGEALIATGDLDPVYVGLVGAGLPGDQLARWLLAYWCFYHAGSASWLSEWTGVDYWSWMLRAAENDAPLPLSARLPEGRWPRSAERRHFRGSKCVNAVHWLNQNYTAPEEPVDCLCLLGEATRIMDEVKQWPQFGPWIAFKAADMLERCVGHPVRFPSDLGLIYAEPREALIILRSEDTRSVWEELLEHFAPLSAPPVRVGGRTCGVQEVETVLCKWKSHRAGHYWVGKDIHEVRSGLAGWGETAGRMLAAMPGEVVRVG